MKFITDRQDETINNYILLSEVIFILLTGIIILQFNQITFYNVLTQVPFILFFLALTTLLIYAQKKKTTGFKYTWLVEIAVSIVYLTMVFSLLRYEFQYLFKITLIMPVIILSLKYGLNMSFLAASLSISTVFYLGYLRNFTTIDADIILSIVIILLAWLLGQMTEKQYEIRSNLELEIASRTQAEKAQKDQLLFLQDLIDNIPNPIYFTDLNFNISVCNKAFADFFGVSRADIINRSTWEILPFDMARNIYELGVLYPANDQTKLELTLINHKGEVQEVLLNSAFICNHHDQSTGLLGNIIDITEQKQFQKEIARVERLNLVGEMAAGIAHEIRNPIATVKGFLQLYQMKSNINTLNNNVDLMIEELDRANSIITEYLSLAKGRALSLSSKNLNQIITSIAPLITADATMSDKDIVFDLQNIPNTLLDEDQIRQMLLNLCRNGLEAMESRGTLTIKTFTQGYQITLMIKDQGKGIDPKIEDKIGTPFVTDKAHGTGLGLAVCYSIATRHNASINYDTGSSGTTFYVKFEIIGDAAQVAPVYDDILLA